MTQTARDLLLSVQDLKIHFFTNEGVVKAVDGASFEIERGKTLCVVGESGSGKSVAARALLQIVHRPGKIVDGKVLYHQQLSGITQTIDITALDPRGRAIRNIRGNDIAMIFQEPMTSLSPAYTIGNQIVEAIRLHQDVSKAEARNRAIEMLRRVGIPKPELRVDEYPFRLSGGMRQRCMIAMALSCNPALLIADEPTTALDVTTQAQILDLMQSFKEDFDMSILFITHDLGVVAEIADDVAVMYLGNVVERGDVDTIFNSPAHPYTTALLESIPKIGPARERLDPIKGMVPSPFQRPTGCPFHPRCKHRIENVCDRVVPQPIMVNPNQETRCHLYDEAYQPQMTDAVQHG
jgi:oligopeptide/dipeptide ABC transporter ATP-binding protein